MSFWGEVLLILEKRWEVTVIISNFTKWKVEQQVPVCTQMVENTSIICFLPFWKKANPVELPCILRVILRRLVFTERWWAYTIQMATVCYMYFCDNNLLTVEQIYLPTDVLLQWHILREYSVTVTPMKNSGLRWHCKWSSYLHQLTLRKISPISIGTFWQENTFKLSGFLAWANRQHFYYGHIITIY